MSSLTEVPPVITSDLTFKYFPILIIIEEVCIANYLVGTKINACTASNFQLIFSKSGITYEPVFPVPFLALAKIFFPK